MAALLLAVLLCFGTAFTVHANPRVSPHVQIMFDANTRIYGLTAWESLGKNVGTLPEFASTLYVPEDAEYLIFPANYFHAYDNVKDIIGGIYSQGRILSDSWLDWGAGFDKNGGFHLFSLVSTISNEPDGAINIRNKDGKTIEIVTAFNCYPWLIKDGEKLNITPFPGASEEFLNRRAQRAFMGQTADGTFMYGMVSGASIYELQEIAWELGLVNATNTDGGASAGVYHNGQLLARPGRELASAVYIIQPPPGEIPEDFGITVMYNGVVINFSKPPLEHHGYIFYPLEDVLEVFSGGHIWNEETFVISGEFDGNRVDIPLLMPGYIVNGINLDIPAELAPFHDNERTYVYLDFIAEGFGLPVKWDGETRTIFIGTVSDAIVNIDES